MTASTSRNAPAIDAGAATNNRTYWCLVAYAANPNNRVVIPTYDTTPGIRVQPSALRRLTPRDVVEGFSIVRDYEPMIDVGWDEAEECLLAEAKWLKRAAACRDAVEFDEVLSAAPEEEAGDDFDWLFRGVDVGVAGLVLVLTAAGYATCYSCRGHAGLMTERVPQVRVGTEPERLELLIGYAERASCGLDMDTDGLVTAYGSSVIDLHRFAQLVYDDRGLFTSMTDPPWREEAMEALDRGDDFVFDDED